MYISQPDLEYVLHLQNYLDRLIKLQENGHTVTKEVNDVLDKINKVYRVGELPSALNLIEELRSRFDAQIRYTGGNFPDAMTKATLRFEYENGDVKTIDLDIPSTIVIVPGKRY